MVSKSIRSNAAVGSAINAFRAAERLAVMAPIIAEMQIFGIVSPQKIATALNERGIRAPWGGCWHRSQVSALLRRLKAA